MRPKGPDIFEFDDKSPADSLAIVESGVTQLASAMNGIWETSAVSVAEVTLLLAPAKG